MLLREGLTVVIAGAPNAGKSTLLNRLAGEDLAIVTATPGTTRDLVRARIDVDGLPVEIIDTAGLRAASDEAELEGIRRAHGALARADLVLWVVDASAQAPVPPPPVAAVPVLTVLNKIDRLGAEPAGAHPAGAPGLSLSAPQATGPAPEEVRLSALTGAGLDELRRRLAARVGYVPSAEALGARRRHLEALRQAQAAVIRSLPALGQPASIELAAEELRLAQRALGAITGEFTSEDLLAEIFASFCIGK